MILILGLVIPLNCIIRLDIDVIHILIALVHHNGVLVKNGLRVIDGSVMALFTLSLDSFHI